MASTLTVLVTNLVLVETLTISLMEIRPLNPVDGLPPPSTGNGWCNPLRTTCQSGVSVVFL